LVAFSGLRSTGLSMGRVARSTSLLS
jgi:hypothetical protein